MFTNVATLLALMATLNGAPVEQHAVYMRTMEVVQVDYTEDIVTCVDAVEFEWQFYGCEDYTEHDLVSCLMDTMGTEDTILDDAIIMTNYTGYWLSE